MSHPTIQGVNKICHKSNSIAPHRFLLKMQLSLLVLPLLLITFTFVLNGVLGSSVWDIMKRLADDGALPRFSQESDGLHVQLPGIRNEFIIATVTNSNNSSSSSSSSSSRSSSLSEMNVIDTCPKSTQISTLPDAFSSSSYLAVEQVPNETLVMAATLVLCSYHDRSLRDETQNVLQSYCKGTNGEMLHRVPGSTVKPIYNEKGTQIGLVLCQRGRCTWIVLAGTQELEDVWTGARGLVDGLTQRESGPIHAGYERYSKVVARAVEKVLKDKDLDNEVIMCGHSAGGVLCLLITKEISKLNAMSQSNKNNQLKWITFGMPAFANPSHSSRILPGYSSVNHLRIYNEGDVVVREGMLGVGFRHGSSPALNLDEESVVLGNEYAGFEDDFPFTRLMGIKGMEKEVVKKLVQSVSSSGSDPSSGTFERDKPEFEDGEFRVLKKFGTLVAKRVRNVKTSHGMFGHVYAVMELSDRKDK